MPSVLVAAVLLCAAGSLGAQSSAPASGTSSSASVEGRNEAGDWVPVQPEREPVPIVSAHASANRYAERVVFRLRALHHLAALQLVQFEVLPTVPR
jgi:hypothetical protein